ncbi:MAG: sugar kinase [Chitinophagaceae bacterium]|nr:MAG: sugar kinase [Chitinophagaceae bacterium]
MICCFGELLLRFSPVMGGRFIADASMPMFIGGAELNVATALALWNTPTRYITALPKNYLAEEIVEFVSGKNIDSSFIQYCGERIGSYYLPQGTDLKNNAVIYDRNYSAFSTIHPGDFDWNEILKDVDWFHFSAISPALNDNVAAVCLEAAKAARARGITVSIDLNYRAKLWQYGKQPIEVMPALLQECDIVMGNIWAANSLLGIEKTLQESTGKSMAELSAAAAASMQLLKAAYPSVKTVAYTFRLDSTYFGCLLHNNSLSVSAEHNISSVADKVGSGDCFMGGLIYGLVNNKPTDEIINYAAAAAVLKLQQKGDATTSSIADVEKYINHG